jgi:hypothetical protein
MQKDEWELGTTTPDVNYYYCSHYSSRLVERNN